MGFIKKHKYKLLSLMLSIVSIFTLFLGINKTYAYETDTFSYTIDKSSVSIYGTQYTIDNTNNDKIIIGNELYTNANFYIRFQLNQLNQNIGNHYVLLNIDFEYSNDNITYNTLSYNSNLAHTIYSTNSTDTLYRIFATNYRYSTLNHNNGYYTLIYNPTPYNSSNNTTSYIYLRFIDFLQSGIITSSQYLRITIYNIDYVSNTDIGLSQYYETYYGQIEDNYNALLSDYNDLQDNYDTLEGNYNTLNNDYNELQENYNQLNGNINNFNDFYKYGFLAFIKNGYEQDDNVYGSFLEIFYTNRLTNVVSFVDYPITLNDISNYFGNTSFSLYDMANHYKDVFDSDINSNDDYYINEINLNLYFQSLYAIDYLDFINNDFNYNMELFIRDDVNNYSLFLNDLDNTNTHIDSTLILSKNTNLKMFDVISFGKIVYDSDSLRPSISLNNVAMAYYQNGFDNGYQSGIQQGRDSQQNIINDLNNQITILISRVANLEHLNQALNEQINSFNSDYNLNNLMWTIASTPFDSFKQIWNVNFFGVNISSAITGFLTGIIVLWIIKKFFL